MGLPHCHRIACQSRESTVVYRWNHLLLRSGWTEILLDVKFSASASLCFTWPPSHNDHDPTLHFILLAVLPEYDLPASHRPPTEFIPPVQEPYQYIIFRASEVKDLAVDEPAGPLRSVHDDPAVLGVRVFSTYPKPPYLSPSDIYYDKEIILFVGVKGYTGTSTCW